MRITRSSATFGASSPSTCFCGPPGMAGAIPGGGGELGVPFATASNSDGKIRSFRRITAVKPHFPRFDNGSKTQGHDLADAGDGVKLSRNVGADRIVDSDQGHRF